MRRWLLTWMHLTLVAAAAAQGNAPMVATPVEPLKGLSPKVQLINPDGSQRSAAAAVQLEKRTQWVQSEQSTAEFLRQKGIVADANAINAFKRLNPRINSEGTIPAGAKVSFFSPALSASADAEKPKMAAFDMTAVARMSVSPQVVEARRHKADSLRLPATAYERTVDQRSHRALAQEVDETAVLVGQRASRMSSMDLALSKFYLASANAKLDAVKAPTGAKIPSQRIMEVEAAAVPVRSMRTMMMEGGSPFQYRPVEVSVRAKPGQADPPSYRVYVLPAGMLEKPHLYAETLLLQLLGDLSFEKLTSPSKYSVAQGEMRVWIGPDYAYQSMAKMVRERSLTKTTPVHASADSTSLSIALVAPDDVVTP